MKAKLRLWRGGGTLILAAGLALGSAPVVSAAGAEVDLDVVTKVVTAYQDLLDSHWTDSNCSLSSCVNASSSVFASSGDKKSQRGSSFGGSSKKGRDERKDSGENPKFTKAEATILRVRDAMKDFGLPIKTAKSTISVKDAKMNADGKVTVSVAVGTTKTYESDNDEPSYMVDSHTLTLSPNPENLFAVVEDTIDPEPQEESHPESIPSDAEFKSLSSDQILGSESTGTNRPVKNSVDADFALLPVHKDKEVATMQQVSLPWDAQQKKPDVQKMVAYALHWTSPKVNPNPDVDVMNPAYPILENNCTNFASQALRAGGWEFMEAPVNVARDPNIWTPHMKDIDGQVKHSHTWGAAANLYVYAKQHSPYRDLAQKEFAVKGDLIFVDWDSREGKKADGELDHTMIVTGTDSPKNRFTTPRISQKTSNRNNITLYESQKFAREAGMNLEKARWYAITTR